MTSLKTEKWGEKMIYLFSDRFGSDDRFRERWFVHLVFFNDNLRAVR